jgi:glycosyltransferase involved in cell wall biosynthesis
MKTPAVSVVIPTFNRATLVGYAIESVLGQTYQDFEVIVVDDGSTDHTPEEVARFGDRIRYLHQKNMGVSAARNTGIRAARGKWIAFLDSDDRWRPAKLERQLHCLQKLNVGLCFTKCVTSRGEVLPDIDKSSLSLREAGIYHGAAGSDLLGHKYCPWLPSMVAEKRLLEKVGLFDESLHAAEDTRIMRQLAFISEFAYLDDALAVIYQGSPGSLTHEMMSEAGRKRLDCYVRVQAEAYWRMMEVDREKAYEARRTLGYFVSRRAEIACAEGQFELARAYAQDGLFLARDLRSILRCAGIFAIPRLCRIRLLKKWSLGKVATSGVGKDVAEDTSPFRVAKDRVS